MALRMRIAVHNDVAEKSEELGGAIAARSKAEQLWCGVD